MGSRLQGRHALVTGGSRGIGRAIIDRFLDEGAILASCGRGTRPDDLDPKIVWFQADMAC